MSDLIQFLRCLAALLVNGVSLISVGCVICVTHLILSLVAMVMVSLREL